MAEERIGKRIAEFEIFETDNEGYVHIKVNFQQESEPWAAVNEFLTDDEENL